MLTLLIFLAILGLLVLSHEFGHFIVAKKSGMKVYEFGFGFPPRLFGAQVLKDKKSGKARWRFILGNKRAESEEEDGQMEHGTIYSFNLIPLGGFVRIKGEEGNETGPDSFTSKPAWQKALTLFAGVGMNVILAAFLLAVGFMIGLPQAVGDFPDVAAVKDRHIEIMQVMADKPADQAGLKAGDNIIKIDNVSYPRLQQMRDYVNEHKNDSIAVTVKRGDQIIEKNIKPFVYPDTGKGGLGVAIEEVGLVRYPWHKAFYFGTITTGFYIKEILLSFYLLIMGLFAGAPVGEALSGPVGIAVMTGRVAKLGLAYLINFTALLSINLAIVNILPIPALDGGRLLFLGISKIIRRPLSRKYEQLAHTLGFALLMLLIVAITIKDVGTFKGVLINFFKKIF